MSTTENLKTAFAGESQANRKYTAFARQADEEGYRQVAKLFRAAAEAETVHALNHLRVLSGVKSTAENLQEAVGGETYEFEKMYPGFITEAEDEFAREAVQSFKHANSVEIIHAQLYKKALDALEAPVEVDYYVCQTCGNTVEGEAPDVCPICGAPKAKFKLVN